MTVRELPVGSIVLTAIGLALAAVPGAAASLELRSDSLTSSRAWELATGQWVHFGWAHALGCLSGFLAASVICERSFGRSFPWLVAGIVAAVGLSVAATLGAGTSSYRGVSGVAHGLLAALGAGILIRPRETRARRAIAGVVLVGLAAKLVFENATGSVLFAPRFERFRPWLPAHLAGALAGAFLGPILISFRPRSTLEECSHAPPANSPSPAPDSPLRIRTRRPHGVRHHQELRR